MAEIARGGGGYNARLLRGVFMIATRLRPILRAADSPEVPCLLHETACFF
jgi:hypothetical protein